MKIVSQLDQSGFFVGVAEADESPLEDGVFMIPGGSVDAAPPEVPPGHRAKWNGSGFDLELIPVAPDPEPPTPPTQFDLDASRYRRRASAKDQLIAYMAADNMSRVRAGVWTVPDLVALSGDPEISALLNDVNTLSFELAVSRLSGITNPMLTPAIKADWAALLTEHFYLVP